MESILLILYLLGCVVCGIMGRKTVFGFVGHFLVAVVITPLGDFVIQAITRPSARLSEKPSKSR